jgi:hypothetical protein
MSAIRAIAWGLLDMGEIDFNSKTGAMLRQGVREELRTHNIRMIACGHGQFRLMRPKNHYSKRHRFKRVRIFTGAFVPCCKRALEIIEPSNPEK